MSRSGLVETCSLANCGISDSVANLIVDCLEFNSSLRSLTLDSNSISPETVVKIIAATAKNKTLEELRCSNQV